MLAVTPAPFSTESLFGYVLRVSEANGYDTPLHILNYGEYTRGSMRSAKFSIDKLAKILGRNTNELEIIALSKIEKNGKYSFKILQHHLGAILPDNRLRLTKPKLCPRCVQEYNYIEAYWDLFYAIACPRHHCLLIDTCPNCKKKLNWFRPGLLTCSCGTNFSDSNIETASTGLIELMAILNAKFYGTSTLALPNVMSFPIEELEKQSLLSFTFLAEKLGLFNLMIKDGEKNKDPYKIMESASSVLANWPTEYHQFLYQFGLKFIDNENLSSVGLRKQFASFYNPLFCSKWRFSLEFLRKEFVRFGLISWGRAITDEKLFRDSNSDIESRFFSQYKMASELGISPTTLRQWLKKELIPYKKINCGSNVRYILDKEWINLAKKLPGKHLEMREAAAMIGIPVSVLRTLKTLGYFIVDHMPKHMSGFHEADLIIFKDKNLQLSSIITLENINSNFYISLDNILHKKQFWSDEKKALFVAAYLDGTIKSVGRTGDSFKDIWFEITDVERFLKKSRAEVSSETISQQEAANLIGCSFNVISELISKNYLIDYPGPNRRRVTLESVNIFLSNYIPISSIAKRLHTSSRNLVKLCRKSKINILSVPSTKTNVFTSFIMHEAQQELFEQVQLNPTRSQRQELTKSSTASALEKLKDYLSNLKENGKLIPRRRLIPNKNEIAKACGLSRNIFYSNPEAVLILNEFDIEERSIRHIKKRDDIGDLRLYLENLKRKKSTFPVNYKGLPNKVAIAKACGINRKIFYSNLEAISLLENYVRDMYRY